MCVKKKKGQSALEFTLVLLVVIAAIIAMQIYMKRAVEGKLRSNTDSIGDQFEADNTSGGATTNKTGKTVQRYGFEQDGVTKVPGQTTVTYENQSETWTGSETVGAWSPVATP